MLINWLFKICVQTLINLLYKTKRSHMKSSIGDCKNTKKLFQVVNKRLKPTASINPYPNIISFEKLPNAFSNFLQDKIYKSLEINTETSLLNLLFSLFLN